MEVHRLIHNVYYNLYRFCEELIFFSHKQSNLAKLQIDEPKFPLPELLKLDMYFLMLRVNWLTLISFSDGLRAEKSLNFTVVSNVLGSPTTYGNVIHSLVISNKDEDKNYYITDFSS